MPVEIRTLFCVAVTQEMKLSSWLGELFLVADSMSGCRCHDEGNPNWNWLLRSFVVSLNNVAH